MPSKLYSHEQMAAVVGALLASDASEEAKKIATANLELGNPDADLLLRAANRVIDSYFDHRSEGLFEACMRLDRATRIVEVGHCWDDAGDPGIHDTED